MNKLKVAVQALRSHLHLDKRGRELLETVVTLANDLRKQLSAADEKIAAQTVKEESLRASYEQASAQEKRSSDRCQQLQDRLAAATAKNSLLEAQVKELSRDRLAEATDMDVSLLPPSAAKAHALLDELMRSTKPVPVRDQTGGGGHKVILLDDFLHKFTDQSMRTLGLLVTTHAVAGLPVFVACLQGIADTGRRSKTSTKFTEVASVMERFTAWLCKHKLTAESLGVDPVETTPEVISQLATSLVVRGSSTVVRMLPEGGEELYDTIMSNEVPPNLTLVFSRVVSGVALLSGYTIGLNVEQALESVQQLLLNAAEGLNDAVVSSRIIPNPQSENTEPLRYVAVEWMSDSGDTFCRLLMSPEILRRRDLRSAYLGAFTSFHDERAEVAASSVEGDTLAEEPVSDVDRDYTADVLYGTQQGSED